MLTVVHDIMRKRISTVEHQIKASRLLLNLLPGSLSSGTNDFKLTFSLKF